MSHVKLGFIATMSIFSLAGSLSLANAAIAQEKKPGVKASGIRKEREVPGSKTANGNMLLQQNPYEMRNLEPIRREKFKLKEMEFPLRSKLPQSFVTLESSRIYKPLLYADQAIDFMKFENPLPFFSREYDQLGASVATILLADEKAKRNGGWLSTVDNTLVLAILDLNPAEEIVEYCSESSEVCTVDAIKSALHNLSNVSKRVRTSSDRLQVMGQYWTNIHDLSVEGGKNNYPSEILFLALGTDDFTNSAGRPENDKLKAIEAAVKNRTVVPYSRDHYRVLVDLSKLDLAGIKIKIKEQGVSSKKPVKLNNIGRDFNDLIEFERFLKNGQIYRQIEQLINSIDNPPHTIY